MSQHSPSSLELRHQNFFGLGINLAQLISRQVITTPFRFRGQSEISVLFNTFFKQTGVAVRQIYDVYEPRFSFFFSSFFFLTPNCFHTSPHITTVPFLFEVFSICFGTCDFFFTHEFIPFGRDWRLIL